ncbi:MAG: TorD/DmsD family molecular chaperone [Thiotrichales bacterium]
MTSGVAKQYPYKHRPLLDEFCLAAAHDLSLLATLHDQELSGERAAELRAIEFPNSLGINLHREKAQSVVAMLRDEINQWPRDSPQSLEDNLAADYASIYLNNYCSASPQESVWTDEDGLAWQDSMFQVREVYQSFELEVENWRVRSDDHLVTQLQFLSYLFSLKNAVAQFNLAAQFMDEHLLRWLNKFSERVAQRCETPFYAGLALLTDFYCETLRDLLSEILEQPRPSSEKIQRRMTVKRTEAVPVKFVPGAQASW